MNEFSKRSALWLLASASLVVLPAVGLTACGSSVSDDSPAVEVEHHQQLVTADSLAGLKPGEHLVLDLGKQGVAYTFDFSKAPIDFSRIVLRQQDGATRPMDAWLSEQKAKGKDLLSASSQSFRLAGSAQGFGNLSPAQVAQLESTGSLERTTKVPASGSGAVSEQGWVCYEVTVCTTYCHVPGPYCFDVCNGYVICEDVEY